MSKTTVPQPNVVRCEDGQYSVECPGCREFVEVDSEERKVESGGHHTEPSYYRYERHYRKEHG
jgi:hypothetical protein